MESLIYTIASNNCASIKDIPVVRCNISDNQLIEYVGKLNQMKFPEETITCKYNRSYDPAKRKRSEVNLNIWKDKSNYTRTLFSEKSRNPDVLFVINGIANGFCNYISTLVSTLK